jgi:hypothetical protein
MVTPAVRDEFLAGGGSEENLQAFLTERNGTYGEAATPDIRQSVQNDLDNYNTSVPRGQQRVIKPKDLVVVADAKKNNVPLLTDDKRLVKTLQALRYPVEALQ